MLHTGGRASTRSPGSACSSGSGTGQGAQHPPWMQRPSGHESSCEKCSWQSEFGWACNCTSSLPGSSQTPAALLREFCREERGREECNILRNKPCINTDTKRSKLTPALTSMTDPRITEHQEIQQSTLWLKIGPTH